MIYLVSRSLCQGRSAAFLSLLGVASGFLFHMLIATAGVTAILLAIPYAYDVLRFGGAAYLIWLAWQAIRPGAPAVFRSRDLAPASRQKLLAMGFVTNVLNPKLAVFYLYFHAVSASGTWIDIPAGFDPWLHTDRYPLLRQSLDHLCGGLNQRLANAAAHLGARTEMADGNRACRVGPKARRQRTSLISERSTVTRRIRVKCARHGAEDTVNENRCALQRPSAPSAGCARARRSPHG